MSASQADLDALDRMIASGVLSMAYDGKRVEYRSMAELVQARAMLAAQVAASASSVSPFGRFVAPAYDRGA